jgi:hypothetical protein
MGQGCKILEAFLEILRNMYAIKDKIDHYEEKLATFLQVRS